MKGRSVAAAVFGLFSFFFHVAVQVVTAKSNTAIHPHPSTTRDKILSSHRGSASLKKLRSFGLLLYFIAVVCGWLAGVVLDRFICQGNHFKFDLGSATILFLSGLATLDFMVRFDFPQDIKKSDAKTPLGVFGPIQYVSDTYYSYFSLKNNAPFAILPVVLSEVVEVVNQSAVMNLEMKMVDFPIISTHVILLCFNCIFSGAALVLPFETSKLDGKISFSLVLAVTTDCIFEVLYVLFFVTFYRLFTWYSIIFPIQPQFSSQEL
jgi:hypothetical protein